MNFVPDLLSPKANRWNGLNARVWRDTVRQDWMHYDNLEFGSQFAPTQNELLEQIKMP